LDAPEHAITFISMNIQSLETPSRRHALQVLLDQASPTFVILIGTKITGRTATRKMFDGYKAYHSHTSKDLTWMQQTTSRQAASKGVSVLIKKCYDVGHVATGKGIIEGRLISLTMFVDRNGTGQQPWALKIGGAYYDCEREIGAERRALSTAIAKDIEESTADAIHYQTDSNCPFQATDLAELSDETYRTKTMSQMRREKSDDLHRAFTSATNPVTKIGVSDARVCASFQFPNVHTPEGQDLIRRGRTCTAHVSLTTPSRRYHCTPQCATLM
jgi:hypothetical protein